MSVLNGVDAEAIEVLLGIHCSTESPKILDCTHNTGKMWKGIPKDGLVRMDKDPSFPIDVCADFFFLPFEEEAFDVVVFDPPHLPSNAASKGSSKIWEKRYGITDDDRRRGDNVSSLFLPFLSEARRVLDQKGIILAKIADLTHNHRYQWQHIDFINAVIGVDMTPCDMMVKCDPRAGRLQSSKWKTVKHLRKSHCYWIVVRKTKSCERG